MNLNFFILNTIIRMNKISFVEPFGVDRELHASIENINIIRMK